MNYSLSPSDEDYRKPYRELQSCEFISDNRKIHNLHQYSRKTIYLGCIHDWLMVLESNMAKISLRWRAISSRYRLRRSRCVRLVVA